MGDQDNARNGVVITFFSTASAVGKTLIACNMASEIARDATVCLVDLDLQFGDVANFLQLQDEYTIADAERDMNVQGDNCDVAPFLTLYEHGQVAFYCLTCPKDIAEAYNIKTSNVQRVIKQLQGMFDYILVDTTSMFSELNLAMLDMSTIVNFLGIVDFIPTIKNMKIGTDTLKRLGYDAQKIRLVLNRSDSKTNISMDDVERVLGQPFYHILPNDFRAASQSIQNGVPLVLSGADTRLAASLRELVDLYTDGRTRHGGGRQSRRETQESHSLFGRLFGH